MDKARFEALAAAYGADLRRWPAAEREAAAGFAAADPAVARAILSEADVLDHLLAASPGAAPSAGLRQAVLANAPKARTARGGLGFWLSGAGLAAAGMAGLIVGASVTTMAVRDASTEAVLAEVLPDDAVEIVPLNLSFAAPGEVA